MDFKRFTLTLMIALAFAINSPSTFASDKTDVVDAVNRYLNNLDTDKIQTAVAMCDAEVSTLDEFPPHAWHGPTACADWWKGLLAYNEKKRNYRWGCQTWEGVDRRTNGRPRIFRGSHDIHLQA